MPYVELAESFSVINDIKAQGDKATREFRWDSDGPVDSLPQIGDEFPYVEYVGINTSNLIVFTREVRYPHDDAPHTTITYKEEGVLTEEGDQTIEPGGEPGGDESHSFDCEPEEIILGDEDKTGFVFWDTGKVVNESIRRRIYTGRYAVTYNTSYEWKAYDNLSVLGHVLEDDDRWLFENISLEEGRDSGGNPSYKITNTYAFRAVAPNKGWLYTWDSDRGKWAGVVTPEGEYMYPIASYFPDAMPI